MAPESPTRVVDPDGLLEHLLRAHLPVDASELPGDLVEAKVADLILRDLGEDLDTEVAEVERKSPSAS